MPTGTGDPLAPAARAERDRAAGGSRPVTVATTVTDLLAYVVVLNLAVQFVPQVLSESFTDSLLTAALLKGVLEVVVLAKRAVAGRVRGASGPLGRGAGLLALWLVMVGSKFVVLETVDLVLGDRVSLGGFWSVTGLVVVLMGARAAVRLGLGALLDTDTTPTSERT